MYMYNCLTVKNLYTSIHSCALNKKNVSLCAEICVFMHANIHMHLYNHIYIYIYVCVCA